MGLNLFSNFCREVFKAVKKTCGQIVALKRMCLETSSEGFPITALREIKLLSKLKHKNIIQILDISTAKYSSENPSISSQRVPFCYPYNFFMVCEYMEHSLAGLIKRDFQFTSDQIRCVMKQILEGLEFLHSNKVMHRDLKCSNILVNSNGEVKLADFGMGMVFGSGRLHRGTKGIATLWYRAPELFTAEYYNEAIDMWAIGCIFGELLSGAPVFKGNSEEEQLSLICSCLGVHIQNSQLSQKLGKQAGTGIAKTLRERFAHEKK